MKLATYSFAIEAPPELTDDECETLIDAIEEAIGKVESALTNMLSEIDSQLKLEVSS
jgi:hypothetical protein